MKKILGNEKGAVAIIIAVGLVTLMLAVAMTIDVGSLFEERRLLQTVADSAALAGAQELPENPDEAIQKAVDYANNNYGENVDSIDVEISFTLATNDTITVTVLNPDAPLYFARVTGENSTPVGASAKAIIASPEEVSNVVPWGVKLDPGEDWNEWLSGQTEKTLKYGPQSYEKNEGNFYALDLDPNVPHSSGGANEYYPRIVDGYEGDLKVGDMIWTEPGNMGKTSTKVYERLEKYGDGTIHDFDELVEDGKLVQPNGQFVMVPVINRLEHPTGEEQIEILAFAPFIITNIVTSGSNKGEIIGKFVSQALIVTDGGVKPVEELGLRVIRLIK
ncbi:hypothetical protein ES705_00042 [subsurface metagenome]|nr:hypothetical protein [Clostridia bacterium]